MPLVIVTTNPLVITGAMCAKLGPDLQVHIADALNVSDEPDAGLTPSDIEVRFRTPGPLDVGYPDLGLDVFANDYPARRANIQRRTEMIANALRFKCTNYTGGYLPPCAFDKESNFVWVMLVPAGFAKL